MSTLIRRIIQYYIKQENEKKMTFLYTISDIYTRKKSFNMHKQTIDRKTRKNVR